MQTQNPAITETHPDTRKGLIPFISGAEPTHSAVSLVPQTVNIMSTQTVALFIDIDEFLVYLVRMLADTPVTVELLALCAVARLRAIIAERPNMTTLVVGETEARSDFAPGNVAWSNMDVPYSLCPDTPGYDIGASLDEIIGLHTYTARTTPARALLDPFMKHAYRVRIFARVLTLIESDAAFAPSHNLSLTIMCPQVAGNYVNFTAGAGARRTTVTDVLQLVHFLETMIVIGYTREASARVEVMAANDCALMTVLLMIEKDRLMRKHAAIENTFAVFVSVPSKPKPIMQVLATSPLAESDDDDDALMPYLVVSAQRLYALLIGPSADWDKDPARHSVASFLAAWIYVNGTQYWPGLHPCTRANDNNAIHLFMEGLINANGLGYTGPMIARIEPERSHFRLVMNVKRLSVLMQRLHIERIRYQFVSAGDVPSTDEERDSVIMSNIAWFYEELLQLRLYSSIAQTGVAAANFAAPAAAALQDPDMRIATTSRDTLAACISGRLASVGDVRIRIRTDKDTAKVRAVSAELMNMHPYAGDVHPLTVQRRALMSAYALAQILAPAPLRAASFAAAFMGHGDVQRGEDDVPVSRTYRNDDAGLGIHGMYADIGFRAETSAAGTRIVYSECANVTDIPLTAEFVEDYDVVVLLPLSANMTVPTARIGQHAQSGLSPEREPLFHGVTIERPSDSVFSASPDERTPLQAAIMSAPERLALLAADKIIALQTLPGRNWLAEYARIMIGASRDDVWPCEYLCLLLTYGLDVFRNNGYEAQWNRATGDIMGLLPRNFMTGAKMQVLVPRFVQPDAAGVQSLAPVYSLQAPHGAYELVGTRAPETSPVEAVHFLVATPAPAFMNVRMEAPGTMQSADAMVLAYLHMQTKRALAHRVTGREVYWRGSRGAMRVQMLIGAVRQLNIADGSATDAQRALSKGIMSPVAEVVDYAVPLLRRDMTPLEWDDAGDQRACIWGRAMEYAWIGVLRYMIAYSVHLKQQARVAALMLARARTPSPTSEAAASSSTGPAGSAGPAGRGDEKKRRVKFDVGDAAPERISTLSADRAGARMNVLTVRPHAGEYLGAQRMCTWACALMMFRGLDPRMIYGNEHTALRMLQNEEFDVEVQNLNTILPIMRGMEVSIGRHGIAVYMNEWTENAAQHYAEYALNLATTKKLGTWTMLASSTLVLSAKIMQEMRPIAFYNVHRS